MEPKFTFACPGIEPLLTPPREHTGTHRSTESVVKTSIPAIESRLDQLMTRIESLDAGVRTTVNESVACALAVQARLGSNVEAASGPQRELYLPHPSLTSMLRRFLAVPNATFKTSEQAEALEFVMAHQRHLLLIGPTAMGKSLVYMLPAAHRDAGTTCVLLPLSALHTDFDRRCRDLNISSTQWTPHNKKPATRIVFVSPEHAQMKSFTDYLIESHNVGLLKQFVIDEAHLVKSHSNFRFCFAALKPLLRCGESSGWHDRISRS